MEAQGIQRAAALLVSQVLLRLITHDEAWASSNRAVSRERRLRLCRPIDPSASPHLRLAASHAPAAKYLAQFPSQTLASVARFVSFVTGSMAALLLLVTMVDDRLLERPLLGRHIVWWLAALGVILTASRWIEGR